MQAAATKRKVQGAPLEGPYATPPSADGLRPSAATLALVRTQVDALLAATPAFHELPHASRQELGEQLLKIAGYAAECVRELCWQSEQLGQTPIVRKREIVQVPVATAQGNNLAPTAANQIARVTRDTLKAISFPTFVADLIRSTFQAILNTDLQQMQEFMNMVNNVGRTVDDFMKESVTEEQAHSWLVAKFPEHLHKENGKATLVDGASEKPSPNFKRELKLDADVSLDESSIEEKLVPAARRRLAESRLQMLSTMVLMGVQRIVITGGKLRATMGFHIDTSDRAREESATDFDFRTAASGGVNMGWWNVSASLSLAYVSSQRASSDSEINVDADLTSEVELHFKTETFPVERFARYDTLQAAQAHTAVPEANAIPASVTNPLAEPPAAGDTYKPYKARRAREKFESKFSPAGSPLPEPKLPTKPLKPEQLNDTELKPKSEVDAAKQEKAEPKRGDKEAAPDPDAGDAKGADGGEQDATPEKAESGRVESRKAANDKAESDKPAKHQSAAEKKPGDKAKKASAKTHGVST